MGGALLTLIFRSRQFLQPVEGRPRYTMVDTVAVMIRKGYREHGHSDGGMPDGAEGTVDDVWLRVDEAGCLMRY